MIHILIKIFSLYDILNYHPINIQVNYILDQYFKYLISIIFFILLFFSIIKSF